MAKSFRFVVPVPGGEDDGFWEFVFIFGNESYFHGLKLKDWMIFVVGGGPLPYVWFLDSYESEGVFQLEASFRGDFGISKEGIFQFANIDFLARDFYLFVPLFKNLFELWYGVVVVNVYIDIICFGVNKVGCVVF